MSCGRLQHQSQVMLVTLPGLKASPPLGVRTVTASGMGPLGISTSNPSAKVRSSEEPLTCFTIAVMMFSLAGIPPLAGFFAKYFVFLAAIKAGLYVLAVIGVLASVVGAYYYLRIVKVMYFDEPAEAFEPMPGLLKIVLGISGVFMLFFFAYPSPLVSAAAAAAKSLF